MAATRRTFLKLTASAGLLAIAGSPAPARAAPALPPEAVGILYDATLCIGCKACMTRCKQVNSVPGAPLYQPDGSIPYEFRPGDQAHDAPSDLSARTLNIIKVYRQGAGVHKDQAEDGYSFVKRQCMHCLEPACASVCPVRALDKDRRTGVVTYDPERCIGCRYCMMACPFGVPKFEWSSTSPRIVKCELCRHRYASGGYAGCCEACPTGASLFGPVAELRREAERRLRLPPGTEYRFPVGRLGAGMFSTRKSGTYVQRIYGMEEAGGTQCLLLAGVDFDLLGFNPRIDNVPYPQFTWAYIKKVPVLIGLLLAAGTAIHRLTRERD